MGIIVSYLPRLLWEYVGKTPTPEAYYIVKIVFIEIVQILLAILSIDRNKLRP